MIIATSAVPTPVWRGRPQGPFLLRGLGDNSGSNFGTDFSSLALPNPFDSVPAPANGPSTINLTICSDPNAPGCTQAGDYGNSTQNVLQNNYSPRGKPNGDPNANDNGAPPHCKILQWLHLADKNCHIDIPWWFWVASGVAGVIVLKNATR